jgi:hypothetical protein
VLLACRYSFSRLKSVFRLFSIREFGKLAFKAQVNDKDCGLGRGISGRSSTSSLGFFLTCFGSSSYLHYLFRHSPHSLARIAATTRRPDKHSPVMALGPNGPYGMDWLVLKHGRCGF